MLAIYMMIVQDRNLDLKTLKIGDSIRGGFVLKTIEDVGNTKNFKRYIFENESNEIIKIYDDRRNQ